MASRVVLAWACLKSVEAGGRPEHTIQQMRAMRTVLAKGGCGNRLPVLTGGRGLTLRLFRDSHCAWSEWREICTVSRFLGNTKLPSAQSKGASVRCIAR